MLAAQLEHHAVSGLAAVDHPGGAKNTQGIEETGWDDTGPVAEVVGGDLTGVPQGVEDPGSNRITQQSEKLREPITLDTTRGVPQNPRTFWIASHDSHLSVRERARGLPAARFIPYDL